MKWDKAKTILIIFLIAVNLSLSIYLILDNMHSEKIEGQVAETVIELLEKDNITIDKKTITKAAKQKKMKTVYVKNIISSYDDFSKKLLGENAKANGEGKYISEKGTLRFEGDYFEASTLGEYALMDIKADKENEEKSAREAMLAIGAKLDEAKSTISQSDNTTTVKFEEKIDDYDVYGANLTAEFSGGTLKKIYGCWYNEQAGGNSVMDLKSPSGALIEYKNRKTNDEAVVIENIGLGYVALETMVYHESVLLIPVWAIKEEQGKEIYINAREN